MTAHPPGERRRRLLDEALGTIAEDLFAHDVRLARLAVAVQFDGGVAHLTGDLEKPDQLRLVRDLLGRLDGVYAVWDQVRVAGREPTIVDLGCGNRPQYPRNIGVDRHRTAAVRLLADLTSRVPFATDSVDRVFAVHVLEHMVDFLPLVGECHRILRPGGILHVMSPWWRHVNAVADPTHLRLLDTQTIKGICHQPAGAPRWYPLHAACDGATVFADLTPLGPDDPGPDHAHTARFFD
jgi:SAM-dependent methyltransferase